MHRASVCVQGKASRRQSECVQLFQPRLPAVLLLLTGLSELSGLSMLPPLPPPPPSPGSCTFERDTCGYTPEPDSGGWSLNTKGTVPRSGPVCRCVAAGR